ncbi:thiamine-phosphate kinase [Ketobacter sp.]|uniref:thiamine-phosphate kinase n=1 Tax=Ketobacter sp. TaxID=2083498 RepID=UPI000F1A675E|nr:thiamine-phosphate kinase [Ketobacter sp.]RLT92226.1 MAG: thiamine-phosphate kinase [Ketobacter sp.]
MNEFALIDAYFKRLSDHAGALLSASHPELMPALGIGDDCALLNVPAGMQLAVSSDTLVAGVHFPASASAYDIGYKSLAVNLSDLAAMGAQPAWFSLCLTLPDGDGQWIESFCDGMAAVMEPSPIVLVGGDTTRGPLSISIQVMGLVPQGKAMTRSGAQVGDTVYVSGCVGEAGLGLRLAQNEQDELWSQPLDHPHLLSRLHRPEPRVVLGWAIKTVAHACIDVSDGLLADLHHLVQASGVGAQLDLNAIPSAQGMDLMAAVGAGDDYELCFTAAPADHDQVIAMGHVLALPITAIGTITETTGIVDLQGQPVVAAGYQHF